MSAQNPILKSWLLIAALAPGCSSEDPTGLMASTASNAPDLSAVADDILALWQDADLVCLGEAHGSVLDGALREALVRDPRFAATVEVIVIEFANPLHQDLLDRLVLEGEALSRDELRPIWRDAGLGEMWELPMYEAFLRAVAQSNAERAREERVPVVGAALPVNWSEVQTAEDLAPFHDRIGHFEAVLHREILDPGQKGLAIFGKGHCERRPPSLLARLAEAEPGRVRAVFGFEGPDGVAAGRQVFRLGTAPGLVPVRGTAAEEWPSGEMFFEGHAYAGVHLGELVDAIVDYGDHGDTVLHPLDFPLDPDLATELERRARLWYEAKSGGG